MHTVCICILHTFCPTIVTKFPPFFNPSCIPGKGNFIFQFLFYTIFCSRDCREVLTYFPLREFCLANSMKVHLCLIFGRPAMIHRCTGPMRYFLPRYEYRILNKPSRYLRYIHICINKHGKALSSISAHPPSTF